MLQKDDSQWKIIACHSPAHTHYKTGVASMLQYTNGQDAPHDYHGAVRDNTTCSECRSRRRRRQRLTTARRSGVRSLLPVAPALRRSSDPFFADLHLASSAARNGHNGRARGTRRKRPFTRAHAHTRAHTHTHAHAHTHARTRTHTSTHTHAHVYTHTHTHTHIHTYNVTIHRRTRLAHGAASTCPHPWRQ